LRFQDPRARPASSPLHGINLFKSFSVALTISHDTGLRSRAAGLRTLKTSSTAVDPHTNLASIPVLQALLASRHDWLELDVFGRTPAAGSSYAGNGPRWGQRRKEQGFDGLSPDFLAKNMNVAIALHKRLSVHFIMLLILHICAYPVSPFLEQGALQDVDFWAQCDSRARYQSANFTRAIDVARF
jgi:hypothetical protein